MGGDLLDPVLYLYGIPQTEPPPPKLFWDCEERENFVDTTGLMQPTERFIPIALRCDDFFDCGNLSDEKGGDGCRLWAGVVAISVIAGILIAGAIALLVAVIVLRKSPVIRVSSPLFLILVIVGAIVGYLTIPIQYYLSFYSCFSHSFFSEHPRQQTQHVLFGSGYLLFLLLSSIPICLPR